MKIIVKSLIFAACFIIAACSVELTNEHMQENNKNEEGVTFKASIEQPVAPVSKVQWNKGDDGIVLEWTSGDEIAIFDGTSVVKSANSAGSGASASFENVTVNRADEYIAWYPYTENLGYAGEKIRGVIPNWQYADKLNIPMFAATSTDKFVFKNACAVIMFTLNVEGITSITLSGNNNEVLAGDVAVDYSTGEPKVSATGNTSSIITLKNSDGSALVAGEVYYIAVLPQTLENGFTLNFSNNNFSFAKVGSKPANLRRSARLGLGTISKNENYVPKVDNNHFKVPGLVGKELSTITFETLFYATSFDGINSIFGLEEKWLIRVGDTGYNNNQLQIATSDGKWPSADETVSFNLYNWYHLAVVWDANTKARKIYINGEEKYSDSGAEGKIDFSDYLLPDGTTTQTVSIGYSYDGRPFHGCFAEMRVWDDVRTQEEIQVNMMSLTETDPSNLMAYWKFNEGSGDKVIDYSDNKFDVTSNSALAWENLTPNLNRIDLKGLSLSADYADIPMGKSVKLNCVFTPANYTGSVYWESSDSSIAKVDQDGTVTAIGQGEAIITAYCEAYSATCEITVIKEDQISVPYMFNNYFPVNLLNATSLEAVTVEWKMFPTKFTDGRISSIFGVEGEWLLRIGDAGIECNQLQLAIGDKKWNTEVKFETYKYYHVAFTYNSTTDSCKVYLNGSLAAENKDFATSTVDLSENCLIGWSCDLSRYFEGYFLDMRVWNVERTSTQIKTNMNGLIEENPSGLMGYWKMDEGYGNSVKDYSGNNINLTAVRFLIRGTFDVDDWTIQ